MNRHGSVLIAASSAPRQTLAEPREFRLGLHFHLKGLPFDSPVVRQRPGEARTLWEFIAAKFGGGNRLLPRVAA
jgi:transcriptional regulator of acetoin/glycerol metabolism